MENIFTAFILIFFVILPLVAIFSFTSKVTSGIYYWADSQHPKEEEPLTYHYVTENEKPYTVEDPEPKINTTATGSLKSKLKLREKLSERVGKEKAYSMSWEEVYKEVNNPKKESLVLKHPIAKSDKKDMESYLGYSLEWEDSDEFTEFLDTNNFDFRDYLTKKG